MHGDAAHAGHGAGGSAKTGHGREQMQRLAALCTSSSHLSMAQVLPCQTHCMGIPGTGISAPTLQPVTS